ncbi:MAG: hemolysin family protein [Puniceicoccales bacterium]|jgi:putative hemolysin|nr:hemolysin family protein [Puniceicoccales bacterium]
MDILIIVLAVCINGFFAMSEIGVVSANKNRLQKLVDNGSPNARKALELINAPSRFLSTVQIGITFAGILGAIYGGAPLAKRIEPFVVAAMPDWTWFQSHALTLCEGFVSLLIGVTSIIFGELIPKRLAMIFPTQVATGVAGFMLRLSTITAPVIYVLSGTADGILRIFGIRKNPTPEVSEDEIRIMVNEGMTVGVFHKGERDMVEGVFELDNLRAGNLMTPRSRMVWINLAENEEVNRRKIAASGYTHFPVCDGNPEKVIGMVSVKSLWANLSLAGVADIRNLLTEPLTVPLNMTATRLLEVFKHERRHIALVIDEYGSVLGLVSLYDVLESVVGDIPGEMPQHDNLKAKRADDGTWVLDGLMEIGDAGDALGIEEFPKSGTADYHTLAGFLFSQLGHIPKPKETVQWLGFTFEILSMDKNRIDKVHVIPPPSEEEKPDEAVVS